MFINRFFRFFPKSGFRKALQHFNDGDYRKACCELETYASGGSGCEEGQDQEMVRMYLVESYQEYAKKLSLEEKYAGAAGYLEKAIRLQPNYADIHYKLGNLYEKLGRSKDSRESFKQSLEINPNFFRARVKLARSYSQEGNTSRSLKQLRACLSESPTFYVEQVKELISLIKNEGPGEDIDRIFHIMLEEKPSSSQVSKQIALEAVQNGDYDVAVAELKKAISLNPNYPDLHNLLGIAYGNKGMADDAIMEFETSLKIHPGYLKARLNMALSLYEKGSKEEAMRHLEKVLEVDPYNEVAKNLLRELQPVT